MKVLAAFLILMALVFMGGFYYRTSKKMAERMVRLCRKDGYMMKRNKGGTERGQI